MKETTIRKGVKAKTELRSPQKNNAKAKTPEGWEKALTPEEFLLEAKNVIRGKFEERNKI